MRIDVSTRHGHLSSPAQDNIRTKVSKLRRFYDRISSIDVIVDLQDESSPSVEVSVSAEHMKDMVAKETHGALNAALDAVLHKIEHQLKKNKEKLVSHRNPGRRANVTAVESIDADLESVDEESAEELESIDGDE